VAAAAAAAFFLMMSDASLEYHLQDVFKCGWAPGALQHLWTEIWAVFSEVGILSIVEQLLSAARPDGVATWLPCGLMLKLKLFLDNLSMLGTIFNPNY
jgi:hypothetical protein